MSFIKSDSFVHDRSHSDQDPFIGIGAIYSINTCIYVCMYNLSHYITDFKTHYA